MKSMKTAHWLLVMAVVGLLVSGCAASQSGSAYSRPQARQAQQVQLGYVEGVRQVQIEGTKTPIGAGAGTVIGGIAGSSIGGGRGRSIATVGGAVLGGLAGAAAEEGITRRPGLEITVRLDDGRMIAVTQEADEAFYQGERVRVLTAYDGTTRVAH